MTRLANIVFGFLFSVIIVKADDFSDPRYAGLEDLFAGHSFDNIFGIRSNDDSELAFGHSLIRRLGGSGYSGLDFFSGFDPSWLSGLNLGNLHGPKWNYARDYQGYAPESVYHHEPVHFSRVHPTSHHFSTTTHLDFPRVHRPVSHDQHFSRVYPQHHISAGHQFDVPKVSLPESITPVYHPISSLGRTSTYPSHHTFSRLQSPRVHHLDTRVNHFSTGLRVPHHD